MGLSLSSLGSLFRSTGVPFPPAPVTANGDGSGEGSAPAGSLPSIDLRGGRASYLEVSVQIHIERSVLNEAGQALGRETIDLSLRYQRLDVQIPAEGEEEPEARGNPLQRLLEQFSPENTAQRIADFVTRGFGRTSFGEEDTPESRGAFVQYLLPFIRKGANDALASFGTLPEDVRQRAEETIGRVDEKLGAFAQWDKATRGTGDMETRLL